MHDYKVDDRVFVKAANSNGTIAHIGANTAQVDLDDGGLWCLNSADDALRSGLEYLPPWDDPKVEVKPADPPTHRDRLANAVKTMLRELDTASPGWRAKFPEANSVEARAVATIKQLGQVAADRDNARRELAALSDKYTGTPCAAERWHAAKAELTGRIAELMDEVIKLHDRLNRAALAQDSANATIAKLQRAQFRVGDKVKSVHYKDAGWIKEIGEDYATVAVHYHDDGGDSGYFAQIGDLEMVSPVDIKTIKSQAAAWMAVSKELRTVDPDITTRGKRGIDCALASIRHLAEKAKDSDYMGSVKMYSVDLNADGRIFGVTQANTTGGEPPSEYAWKYVGGVLRTPEEIKADTYENPKFCCDYCGQNYTDYEFCCEARRDYLGRHKVTEWPLPPGYYTDRQGMPKRGPRDGETWKDASGDLHIVTEIVNTDTPNSKETPTMVLTTLNTDTSRRHAHRLVTWHEKMTLVDRSPF